MSLRLAGYAGSGTSMAAGHATSGDHVTDADYAAGGDHAGDEELVIYCPHPLGFINPIASELEGRTGIWVFVQIGGTGELLKMAEEGNDPPYDIF